MAELRGSLLPGGRLLRGGCPLPPFDPFLLDVGPQLAFDRIDDIARDLRTEDLKIVGQDDKNEAQKEAPAVFPEILVYGL